MPSRSQPTPPRDAAAIFSPRSRPIGPKRAPSRASKPREDRRARELIWIASHDLRAPLAAIKLHAGAFTRRATSGGPALTERDWLEAMARIERAANRALEMIDEVLTIEQLSESPAANMPVLATVDVEETIGEAIFLNRELLKQARCGVVVTRAEGEGRMRGAWNRSCLLRLFSNLLQNVSKHAPESPILIHLERHGDNLRVRFADRGPGLPVGMRLDEETTFDSRAGGGRGFGLGLWIIRRAVAQLLGSLKLSTAPGLGVVFDIELPMPRPI
jgi:two-component system, OmpR family, sensor histidine kinase KdpD